MSDEMTASGPVVVGYETMSGVMIHVTPLSVFTINAIHERSADEYPYPDPKPYEKPLENAADRSIKAPAMDDPEYKALCKAVDEERMAWRVRVSIDLACEYPAFDSREAMMAYFRPKLEKIRLAAALPDDEWQAVLMHCVFTGRHDRQTVINIATQDERLPLTPAEVVEGIRFFRLELQGPARRRLDRQQPSGVKAESANGSRATGD